MTVSPPHSAVEADAEVTVPINYSVPTTRRPFIVNGEFEKNEIALEARQVVIRDAAASNTPPRLEVEGFTRISHPVDVSQIEESREVLRAYREELRTLILDLTGADEVIMLPGETLRRQDLGAEPGELDAVRKRDTANFVHSDYSLDGVADAQALSDPRPSATARRTAMFNMWRLLSPGPTNCPLALCDASTVDHGRDIIPGDTRFPATGKQFEMAFVRANPRHRWQYFSDLTAADLIVFKQADTDASFPRLVPHTAFIHPSCTPAAPRRSIESRCIAVWDN